MVLSGNSYTRALAELGLPEYEKQLVHKSNAKGAPEKIMRMMCISYFFLVRLYCRLMGVSFILCVPHVSGNYGAILRLFFPDRIVLLDDGITFEYWSDFHKLNIAPVLALDKFLGYLGPNRPIWDDGYKVNCCCVSRSLVVGKILELVRNVVPKDLLAEVEGDAVIFLDNGRLSCEQLLGVVDSLGNRFGKKVFVVTHPSRKDSHLAVAIGVPVESFVIQNRGKVAAVVGFASTALFNLSDCNIGIDLYSIGVTGYADLDQSMASRGIFIIEDGGEFS